MISVFDTMTHDVKKIRLDLTKLDNELQSVENSLAPNLAPEDLAKVKEIRQATESLLDKLNFFAN